MPVTSAPKRRGRPKKSKPTSKNDDDDSMKNRKRLKVITGVDTSDFEEEKKEEHDVISVASPRGKGMHQEHIESYFKVTPKKKGKKEEQNHSKYNIGQKIEKKFPTYGDQLFNGKIDEKRYDDDYGTYLYHVTYEDGDSEEMEENEIAQYLKKATSNSKSPKRKSGNASKRKRSKNNDFKEDMADNEEDEKDIKINKKSKNENLQATANDDEKNDIDTVAATGSSRYGRRRKVINYNQDYVDDMESDGPSDDDNDNDDEERPSSSKRKSMVLANKTNKKSSTGKKKSTKKPQKKTQDRRRSKEKESDSEASFVSEEDDDELSFDEDDSDDDDDDVVEVVKKSKGKTRKISTTGTAKAKEKVTKAAGGPVKQKMYEAFKPFNVPLYPKMSLKQIHEEKEFLDPCGMEATDDIIDRLVGDQIDKIALLLQRSLENEDEIGSMVNPLKLGTACSGTDAPALALTIIQEQMELRGMKKLFNFTHEFSCENEAFKQAYLARNFDSLLYPDITKLADDPPRDVYGQEQPLPDFNMFIAGTSCKNFSMLRSKYRIDIEDKGCSGETFLAATDVLFKEKPPFAIFENVTGAPWAKMGEYITGRVKLSECSSSKDIKNIKDKNQDLIFALVGKDIVVDKVPSVYGVRCGAVVEGYLKPGSNKLHNIEWPKSTSKSGSCTLTELMKKNGITKATDTLVLKTECTYCTHTVNVDTKNFGLPQTRNRTYMFVWKPDDDNVNDDLGPYWEAIVKHLEAPVRHSLRSFILNVDHDIIRVFREALRGPPGRLTKRGVFLEPDFWTSSSANLPHNKTVREKLGMKDMARSLMNWEGYGKKQIPPHYWLEYWNCNYQRVVDMMDILHGSSARDAESHDSSFVSYYWNISQNASKEKHRSATPGIAGCITPGGDFFLPDEGRPLLGCEKLLIQGIPYFRLALGNETEVQLGDLAGNAMSLTVVCATMLAAISCRQLRRETMDSNHGDLNKVLMGHVSVDTVLRKAVSPVKNKAFVTDESRKEPNAKYPDAVDADAFFEKLASFASAAKDSSIRCTCETSGSNSLSTHFLECKVCRVSCCRNCLSSFAGYNLASHETVEVNLSEEDHSIGTFQVTLRNIVPPVLYFNKEGIKEIAGVNNDQHRVWELFQYTFCLHRISRERGKWLIVYYARENNGIGKAVAEFRLSVGELKKDTISSELGMKGELTSFFPALREPFVYGPLEPCASIILKSGEPIESKKWRYRLPDTKISLNLEGSGSTDSFRVEVGLTDEASSALEDASRLKTNLKNFGSAKKRGEEHRWLYKKNWSTWPETITIENNDDTASLSGQYLRARCRQTINQSALWVRSATQGKPPMYILIKPNANRTGPDQAIITSSIDHDDLSNIRALLPSKWQPCDALTTKTHEVTEVQIKNWATLTEMECKVVTSNVSVDSPRGSPNVLATISGLNETEIAMLCRGSDLHETEVQLNVARGQQAQQIIRVFNSVCVAAMLKHAAIDGLKYDLNPDASWTNLPPGKTPFGCCEKVVPPRPTEEWFFDDERGTWERRYDPRASREYSVKLQNSPLPFELWVDRPKQKLIVKCFPEVVSHHAAHQLIEGRGITNIANDLQISFRLTDILQQSDPVISPFKVFNCETSTPTYVKLKDGYELYERQQKVVTKMLAIENAETDFEELEMSEQEMPGSAGLSLISKAERKTKLSGGVIADAIGSGKTVVSISIILEGLAKARKSRSLPNKSGATLVVVPPALIDQWENEIEKFTDSLVVQKVYDLQSLKKLKVQQIIDADVVIMPIDILESAGYLDNLVKLSKLGVASKGVPTLPPYTGQSEQNAARGVWIPANSTDPYDGANNPRNQLRRNQTAYYTYIYLRCISELRSKVFKSHEKGIPIEWFEWERVIVDEIHESLCTSKREMKEKTEKEKKENNNTLSAGFYKEKNRRAGRELLGLTQKDIKSRPLVFRKSIFGLTGTPLLDNSNRVIELANLMGGTYIIGLSSHWRKLERESCRDIFLHHYLEPKQSREIRKNIHSRCQDYLRIACCRNKTGEEMDGIELKPHRRVVRMTESEKELYLKSQSGINPSKQSLSIQPEDFDASAGHDISKFLKQNARFETRGNELVKICNMIRSRKGDENTKIVVFTDGRIDAGIVARTYLNNSGIGCTWLDRNDSTEVKNEKISWYQSADATEEDRKRPRVLVLHFEHAAGLNLQMEIHDLILFTPLYVGDGGSSGDPVTDASTELQAIGRVHRPGQPNPEVNIYRIEVQGPNGEETLDGQLIRRNTDEETVSMAVNAGE